MVDGEFGVDWQAEEFNQRRLGPVMQTGRRSCVGLEDGLEDVQLEGSEAFRSE